MFPPELLRWCNEKAAHTDTAGTIEFVKSVKTIVTDVLCGREPFCDLKREQLWLVLTLLERCEEALSVNTGIKHIFGLIAVKSIGDGAPEK